MNEELPVESSEQTADNTGELAGTHQALGGQALDWADPKQNVDLAWDMAHAEKPHMDGALSAERHAESSEQRGTTKLERANAALQELTDVESDQYARLAPPDWGGSEMDWRSRVRGSAEIDIRNGEAILRGAKDSKERAPILRQEAANAAERVHQEYQPFILKIAEWQRILGQHPVSQEYYDSYVRQAGLSEVIFDITRPEALARAEVMLEQLKDKMGVYDARYEDLRSKPNVGSWGRSRVEQGVALIGIGNMPDTTYADMSEEGLLEYSQDFIESGCFATLRGECEEAYAHSALIREYYFAEDKGPTVRKFVDMLSNLQETMNNPDTTLRQATELYIDLQKFITPYDIIKSDHDILQQALDDVRQGNTSGG